MRRRGRSGRATGRLWLAYLRRRPTDLLSLGIVVLAAGVCFALLTSTTAASRLSATRTVRRNFRAAYEILVRPRGARSAFERRHHLVDDGFLSGLFGGITMRQYHLIASLPGVSLAAPVANVGYFLIQDQLFIPLPAALRRPGQALYRVKIGWSVHDGLERYPAPTNYLYWTRSPLTFSSGDPRTGLQRLGARELDVCEGFYKGEPVAVGNSALGPLFSCATPALRITGTAHRDIVRGFGSLRPLGALLAHGLLVADPPGQLGVDVEVFFPVLVAGIDPRAEQRLVGLRGALVSGRYLSEGQGLSPPRTGSVKGPPFVRYLPVIASDKTFLDQSLRMAVSRLAALSTRADLPDLLASPRAYRTLLAARSGPVLARATLAANTAWREVLNDLRGGFAYLSDGYWRVSGTRDAVRRGVVTPAVVHNSPRIWMNSNAAAGDNGGISMAPPGAGDTDYRRVRLFSGAAGAVHLIDGRQTFLGPVLQPVGVYDPSRLIGFSPLSRVPLQTFFPPTVSGADSSSRRALGDRPLGPTTNLGGYIAQPPLLLTTLQGAIALDNGDGEQYYSGYSYRSHGRTIHVRVHNEAYQGASPRAPVSAVQVRVRGVTGPNALSLARIRLVAEEIAARTGLTVDVTAGSSPTRVPVSLAAGRYGSPPLRVFQQWVKEGVDSAVIRALAAKDEALLILVLVVCALSVGAATLAMARRRSRELAIMSALGWRQRAVVGSLLAQVAAVGLPASLVALALACALDLTGVLSASTVALALIVPVSVAIACAAAAVPALRASTATPRSAISRSRAVRHRRTRTRGIASLALSNLVRLPARSLLAAGTLALAVGAFAFVVGVQLAFRGAVAGTLLGDVISVQVSGEDLAAAAIVAVVGAVTLGDVLLANVRERRLELMTMRAVGWNERALAGLLVREGMALGLVGALLGVAASAVALALLGAPALGVLQTAAVSGAVGCLCAAGALGAPLRELAASEVARSLAEET